MSTRIHHLIVILLLGLVSVASGQSSMMELRKKVNGRKTAATRSYLQQVDDALSQGDTEAADKALKAAIAQGTLSQAAINDARGRISAVDSQQRAGMVAAARAKEEAARQSQPSGTASTEPTRSNGTASARMCQIKVEGGEWFNAVRFFNVDASGNETSSQSDASPGNCTDARKSAGENDWTNDHTVIISDGDKGLAGTYGYELKYVEVTSRGLINNQTGRRKTYKGTFTVPTGSSYGTLTADRAGWDSTTLTLRPYWSK